MREVALPGELGQDAAGREDVEHHRGQRPARQPPAGGGAGALVVVPQPISGTAPSPSIASTARTAVRDHGSCAPISAQPSPSRTRWVARSRTAPGICSRPASASHAARVPVGPAGSLAGRAGCAGTGTSHTSGYL
jgi:hypothetical protein